MVKHILLATDLSVNSQLVVKRAKQLADMFGAKLSVIHALEYRPIVYGGGEFAVPVDAELMAVFEKNAHNALAQLGQDLDIADEDQYFAIDKAKRAITSLAEQLNVDLIVVGSRGPRGTSFLLGSTANAILHTAKCDVLAVRI